ncbi:MAG: F0F1 ATP synthase subunit delta [Pontibacterium sp.]
MAELNTVARPYTKAVFESALDKGTLEQWSSFLTTASAVSQDEKVGQVLGSPSLTSQQKAEAFLSICEDQADDAAKNFIKLLADNKRLPLLPEIGAQFEQLKANHEKSVEIDVTTAYALDEQQQQKLSQALSTKLGCNVALSATVDASILGGVVIRADDLVIDGSVRARVAKLAEALTA